jgi:hypothetical protein
MLDVPTASGHSRRTPRATYLARIFYGYWGQAPDDYVWQAADSGGIFFKDMSAPAEKRAEVVMNVGEYQVEHKHVEPVIKDTLSLPRYSSCGGRLRGRRSA